jgi:hypothetical protein
VLSLTLPSALPFLKTSIELLPSLVTLRNKTSLDFLRAVEGTLLITVIGNYPVSAQGTINIPEYAHYANQSVIVGVPYSCKLTTVPLELNNPGNATVNTGYSNAC